MTRVLWCIATDTREYEAHNMSGTGAEQSGGRWNRPGRPLVHAASTASLACLETVVHLNAGDLPLNRFLVRIEVPAAAWAARRLLADAQLPVGWSAIPEGKVSLDVGDAWLRTAASALLVVPSVIVPEECNLLINPLHPDAAGLRAARLRPCLYDRRLA